MAVFFQTIRRVAAENSARDLSDSRVQLPYSCDSVLLFSVRLQLILFVACELAFARVCDWWALFVWRTICVFSWFVAV